VFHEPNTKLKLFENSTGKTQSLGLYKDFDFKKPGSLFNRGPLNSVTVYLIASSFYVMHFFTLKNFKLLFILTFKCPYNPLPPSLSSTTQFKYVQKF
jgi:hypothetical protein